MHKLDSRLRKLEGAGSQNVAPWLRLIQHNGESKDDFQARISQSEGEGFNILARSIIGPIPIGEQQASH